jgi:type VI secretion system protein ImpK
MTPTFARAVDPIFLYALDLMSRVADDDCPLPQEERIRIRSLIDQGAALLPRGEEWELAKYAIVSWIDDVLVNSSWSYAGWWQNNVMEVELFNTRLCFEQFFVNAQRAAALPNRDALEVYYICGILGFRGLYTDPQTASMLAPKHGLPADFPSWAKQVSMSIRLGQGRPELAAPGRELYGAPPLKRKSRTVWPWLVAAMLAICNATYYFWSSV